MRIFYLFLTILSLPGFVFILPDIKAIFRQKYDMALRYRFLDGLSCEASGKCPIANAQSDKYGACHV
jgi:hypothetical protein